MEKQIIQTCLQCGKQFYIVVSEVKRGSGKYCSRICTSAARVLPANRTCLICGTGFRAKASAIKKGNGKFCSRTCLNKYKMVPRITVTCHNCGNDFEIRQRDIDRGRGTYCSRKCAAVNLRGADSPVAIHGKWTNGGKWQEAIDAKNILNHAVAKGEIKRESCETCGKPNAHGHHEDYAKPLEVKWLCPKHHMRLHAKERNANKTE